MGGSVSGWWEMVGVCIATLRGGDDGAAIWW
jgi:hypothetical protein